MPDLDLILAILHHLFVFALFGVLFAEFVVVRPGMDAATVSNRAKGSIAAVLSGPQASGRR